MIFFPIFVLYDSTSWLIYRLIPFLQLEMLSLFIIDLL